MLRQMQFIIPVQPIAWHRARLSQHGGFYDDQAHDKVSIGLILRNTFGSQEPFTKPVALDITFFMQRPKNNPKKQWPTSCDIDNLTKFLMDTLTKARIWKDDRLVCEVNAKKMWAEEKPQYLFTIREL